MKKFFTAGLLVWLPLAITLWLVEKLIRYGDLLLSLLPPRWQPDQWLGVNIPGLGVVLGLAVVFVTGMIVANILGQKVVAFWEALLSHIPLVRTIYSSVKQITATFLSSSDNNFKEVVLVQFPRQGTWTYGFVVGVPSENVRTEIGLDDLVTVYIPTAPNPTSGYAVMMRRQELLATKTTVEQALKFHVSLGLVDPHATQGQKIPEQHHRNTD